MKRFLLGLLLFLLFFLVPAIGSSSALHTQSHAALWVGKNFGIDLDAAMTTGAMSGAPYAFNLGGYYQMMSLSCRIVVSFGPDFCTNDPTIFQQLVQKSAVHNIATAMGSMYDNPPADLAYWVYDSQVALGFRPKQVYAQGIGFTGLAPLLPVWKAFRNIAYALLAVAMAVVGFMVMLRKRIDPKTVVTVQNALPRIVIALILITFSYAIAGLLIDGMYLVMGLISVIVSIALPDFYTRFLLNGHVNFVSGGFFDLLVATFTPLVTWYPSSRIVTNVIQGPWEDILPNFISGIVATGLTGGPLFTMLMSLFYLFAFVRLLFSLLGSYTQILLAVIIGPIQILSDVFPGSSGFSSWVKNLIANLIPFPITAFLLMIATAINQHITPGTLWTPPFLPQPISAPGANNPIAAVGGFAEALISLGIVMVIPSIINSAKEAFKTSPIASFGVNLGGATGTATQLLSTAFYAREFLGKPKIVPAPPTSSDKHGDS